MAIGANTTGDVSGTSLANGPISTGPSLDAIAQQHGYPDFAAWQAAEPELAQQAYNQQPSGDPSQATTEKPGPRGWRTIPWKQLAINFGSVIGLAFLDGLGNVLTVGADGTPTIAEAGTYSLAGNTVTTASGTFTLGDTALLGPGVGSALGLGAAAGNAPLSSLTRGNQTHYAQQDQPLRNQPTDKPAYNETVDVKAPPDPVGAAGYTPPPPTLRMAGTVGLPGAVATATAAHLGAPPPPQPPKTGTSLTSKVFDLLGLGADYLASRQSQNATAAATQQLVQAGQQAKADLSKVYGGVTPVLSDVVQRQQANLAPYTSLGSGAASLLGYGLGIPNVTAAPSGVYAPPADPFGTFPSLRSAAPAPPNSMLAPSFQQGASPFVPAVGQPPVQPFPQGTDTVAPPAAANLSSLDPQTQTQSSYVTMRAPTGDIEHVPASQVAWYQSRGAVVA